MNIDLRQLRSFVVVAEERSFTRAAARLNMTQPPLSRRIKELEEEVGFTLFERGQRPLSLSAPGKMLFDQAMVVLRNMDALERRVRDFGTQERSDFTVGLVQSTLYS